MTSLVWERTADPRTWQAHPEGAVLTVSRLPGGWRGLVETGGRFDYGAALFGSRRRAQAWCAARLGGDR